PELEQLRSDPYPLARLIAEFALARTESRGSHRRVEYPRQDPARDGLHQVLGAEGLRWERWD
ncbi:MAG: L-aspartate oxidase, partial [Solirubrobacterales bacterium]